MNTKGLKSIKNIEKIIQVLFIVAVIGIALTYSYTDLMVTQNHGIEVWNALFSGNIIRYYEYCVDPVGSMACYDFTMYIFFAIWNFPVWIYEKISGARFEDSLFWILYGKMFVVILYFIAIRLMKKLYEKLTEQTDDNNLVKNAIFFGSSLILLTYTVYTGTYDIISLNLILYGLNALSEGRKRDFIICFAVAATLKYFALWIFIPIVLLKEKKIYRIIIDLVLCLIPTILLKIIFNKDEVMLQNELTSWANYGRISDIVSAGKTEIFNSSCSLCILFYAILCIYCYFIKVEKDKIDYMIIYICTLAWGLFFFFVPVNGFWGVLLAPFIMLIVISNKDNVYINTLLEFVFSLMFVMLGMIRHPWVVGGFLWDTSHGIAEIIVNLFQWKIPSGSTLGYWLLDFDNKMGIGNIFTGLMIACFVGLMVINCPSERVKKMIPGIKDTEFNVDVIMLLRVVVNFILVCLPTLYYLYFIKTFN